MNDFDKLGQNISGLNELISLLQHSIASGQLSLGDVIDSTSQPQQQPQLQQPQPQPQQQQPQPQQQQPTHIPIQQPSLDQLAFGRLHWKIDYLSHLVAGVLGILETQNLPEEVIPELKRGARFYADQEAHKRGIDSSF
jgi:hypothetical protein